ncbi:gas vesicle protein GvpC, partial [Sphaerospermopsis aphanizomenoides BCCUSP55]|uniref:gas vesicle protein GvpC n=1 Tax=Sphaerospermopsis aphanizomenoides TaxID=459663 RepID=UPI001907BDF8
HQFQQQLEQQMNDFLANTAKERIAQGKAQAQQLHQFHQQLEQQTDDFLANTAKERIAKANEQKQSLRQFRQDLFVSVFGVSSL